MKEEVQFPITLVEAVKYFGEGDNAFNFMVGLRWPNGVRCPRCGGSHVGYIATRKMWECKDCTTKRQFTVKVGTIFEDSALPIEKWLAAIWMIANAKNGVSSYEVARSIGVTQKTAWFMLHRIRLAMQMGSFDKLSGTVEADETFIGGRIPNMHYQRRRGATPGHEHMTPVMGMLERGSEQKTSHVKVQVLNTTRRSELIPNILRTVKHGSEVFTDAHSAYVGLHHAYTHEFIDHMIEYVRGRVHTNGLENFWSLLKRTLKGTYVNVEPFHLSRYLDEQAFRFNERKDCDAGRFVKVARSVIGKGLRYLDLIDGKGGEDLPQEAKAW